MDESKDLKMIVKKAVVTCIVGGFPVAVGFLIDAILDINTLKAHDISKKNQIRELKLNMKEAKVEYEQRRLELKQDIINRLDSIEQKIDAKFQ